jgi:hypothetical protein
MTEKPGGLQVYYELEPGRLHDREVGGLGALEDVAGIDANLTPSVGDVGSVAHQPAGCDKITDRGGSRCRHSLGRVGRKGARLIRPTREWFRAFAAHSFLACRPLRPRGIRRDSHPLE